MQTGPGAVRQRRDGSIARHGPPRAANPAGGRARAIYERASASGCHVTIPACARRGVNVAPAPRARQQVCPLKRGRASTNVKRAARRAKSPLGNLILSPASALRSPSERGRVGGGGIDLGSFAFKGVSMREDGCGGGGMGG